MKKAIVKLSKICLLLFAISIVALVVMLMVLKGTTLPPAFVITFLLIAFATVICIAIAAILDIAANVKSRGWPFALETIGLIIALWIVFLFMDYYMDKQGLNTLETFEQSVLCVCAIRAGNYIFFKHNK